MILHFRSPTEMLTDTEQVFRQLFERSTSAYMILTPDLKIAAANGAYYRTSQLSAEQIIGEYLFDAVPGNPNDPEDTGPAMLHASLETVRTELRQHRMGIQRYDVQDEQGVFRVRYWLPVNWIAHQDGRVLALIHQVREVKTGAPIARSLRRDSTALVQDTRRVSDDLMARRRQLVEDAMSLATEAELLLTHRRRTYDQD